jgi:hypothetical protein
MLYVDIAWQPAEAQAVQQADNNQRGTGHQK